MGIYLITYRTAKGESFRYHVNAKDVEDAKKQFKRDNPNAIPISLTRVSPCSN